jgi:hypothetical protein
VTGEVLGHGFLARSRTGNLQLLVVTVVKQLGHRCQNPADPLPWSVSR